MASGLFLALMPNGPSFGWAGSICFLALPTSVKRLHEKPFTLTGVGYPYSPTNPDRATQCGGKVTGARDATASPGSIATTAPVQ